MFQLSTSIFRLHEIDSSGQLNSEFKNSVERPKLKIQEFKFLRIFFSFFRFWRFFHYLKNYLELLKSNVEKSKLEI